MDCKVAASLAKINLVKILKNIYTLVQYILYTPFQLQIRQMKLRIRYEVSFGKFEVEKV